MKSTINISSWLLEDRHGYLRDEKLSPSYYASVLGEPGQLVPPFLLVYWKSDSDLLQVERVQLIAEQACEFGGISRIIFC